MSFGNLFSGQPGSWSQQSNLTPQQQKLQQNLLQANAGQGAGGSFGTSADYYRDLLSNDSNTFNQFQQPELRQFNEQTLPGIAEQYAGLGSGGLSSSGFRNASINAGTDLSERLGALRAQLRQQGAAGLMNLGQQGLQQTTENVYREPTGGLGDLIGPALGAAGTAFGVPFAGTLGAAAGKGLTNLFKNKGGENKFDYGQPQVNPSAQPSIPSSGNGFNLPSWR
jgi:hypothetical protein